MKQVVGVARCGYAPSTGASHENMEQHTDKQLDRGWRALTVQAPPRPRQEAGGGAGEPARHCVVRRGWRGCGLNPPCDHPRSVRCTIAMSSIRMTRLPSQAPQRPRSRKQPLCLGFSDRLHLAEAVCARGGSSAPDRQAAGGRRAAGGEPPSPVQALCWSSSAIVCCTHLQQ